MPKPIVVDPPDPGRAAFREAARATPPTRDGFRRSGPERIAGAAGSGADPSPEQDRGSMHGRHFEGPDGRVREAMRLGAAALAGAAAPAAS